MKSIPAQEIKRRGISAVDELLAEGPVQIIKQNQPRYVVMSLESYEGLMAGASAWDWLDRPLQTRRYASRSKIEIDAALEAERNAWDEGA
ncbi:MAG: type II toxin-antitoxin system Phd/YefM family antitoxin [Thiohalocapsa sp.]